MQVVNTKQWMVRSALMTVVLCLLLKERVPRLVVRGITT